MNLNNVLVMTEDFNIRNIDWDLSYSHHSSHADILMEINDSLDLRLHLFKLSSDSLCGQFH